MAHYNDRDVRTIVELGKTIDFDPEQLFHLKACATMRWMMPVTGKIRYSHDTKTDPESG